jgi:hypothetical protein
MLASRKLVSVVKNKSIDKLWVYASHSTISTLFFLLKIIKIKYHLSIQDDYKTHLPIYESRVLKEKFKFIIENADSIDFISNSMESHYRKVYNITSRTMIFYISNISHHSKLPKIKSSITKIGYAGNIWCGASFIPLLKALEECSSMYNIKINLLIFTQNMPRKLFNNYSDFVEFKGFKSYELLLNELQNCDLLYLPMSFNQKDRDLNVTSFPSKILTYLNSAIPILNHSPADSATNDFIMDNNVGFSINSEDKDDFVRLILSDNYKNRRYYSENSRFIIELFDHNKMIKSLNTIIFEN